MTCECCGHPAIQIHAPDPEQQGRLHWEWVCSCGWSCLKVMPLVEELEQRAAWAGVEPDYTLLDQPYATWAAAMEAQRDAP